MTPAEHARLIDRMEFAAECKAVRKRALAYAKHRRQQRRQQFLDWLEATAEEPTDWQDRVTANREAIKHCMAAHFEKPAKLYTYNGEAKTLTEWSTITGIKYRNLLYRVRSGMDFERALTMKNRGRAKLHTVNGVTKTLEAWADHIGITYNALTGRLKTRTLEEALAMPAGRHPKQPLPGVLSNLEEFLGTGAGSTAQEIPDITSQDNPA